MLAVVGVVAGAALANAAVPKVHWEFLGKIPAAGGSAQALVLDPLSQALYVGVQRGLFMSLDGGVTWQPLKAEGGAIASRVLAYDAKQSALFGSDGYQIFRLTGDKWRVFTVSAQNNTRSMSAQGRPAIWGLVADEQRNALYVGAVQEFLRSADGGETWEWEGTLPAEGQAVALDELQGDVYVASATSEAVYGSRDGGRIWFHVAQDSVGIPLAYATSWDQWGVMTRWIDDKLVWTAESMQGLWELPRAMVEAQNCVVRPLRGAGADLVCAWGLQLMRSDLQSMPLPWLAFRLWVWQLTAWLGAHLGWTAGGLAIVIGLTLLLATAHTVLTISRRWGVPVWAAWFAQGRVEQYARPAALAAAWPDWERQVRAELAGYGDVRPVDLVDIPAPFRGYALRRYAGAVAPREWLEAGPAWLRLRPEAHLPGGTEALRGRGAALIEGDELAGGAAEALAQRLAEALGISVGRPRVLAGARVYLAEAVTLPGCAPSHLNLMILEAAWVETVKTLAGLLQKSPDDLALLVLPEGEAGAMELRQALTKLLRAPHFVVVGPDELARLLLAREPCQVLADLIKEQV